MCLVLNKDQQEVKVAERDISCYKVLQVVNNKSKNKKYLDNVVTPYEYERLPASGLFNANGLFPNLEDIEAHKDGWKEVGKGVIHCYKNLEDAQRIVDRYKFNYIIISVVIKEGTQYYENNYEIAARRIYYDAEALKHNVEVFMKENNL